MHAQHEWQTTFPTKCLTTQLKQKGFNFAIALAKVSVENILQYFRKVVVKFVENQRIIFGKTLEQVRYHFRLRFFSNRIANNIINNQSIIINNNKQEVEWHRFFFNGSLHFVLGSLREHLLLRTLRYPQESKAKRNEINTIL